MRWNYWILRTATSHERITWCLKICIWIIKIISWRGKIWIKFHDLKKKTTLISNQESGTPKSHKEKISLNLNHEEWYSLRDYKNLFLLGVIRLLATRCLTSITSSCALIDLLTWNSWGSWKSDKCTHRENLEPTGKTTERTNAWLLFVLTCYESFNTKQTTRECDFIIFFLFSWSLCNLRKKVYVLPTAPLTLLPFGPTPPELPVWPWGPCGGERWRKWEDTGELMRVEGCLGIYLLTSLVEARQWKCSQARNSLCIIACQPWALPGKQFTQVSSNLWERRALIHRIACLNLYVKRRQHKLPPARLHSRSINQATWHL